MSAGMVLPHIFRAEADSNVLSPLWWNIKQRLVMVHALVMMMVAPNSLVRQEGAQKEEEEQVRGRRRAGSKGTPIPGADAPTGPTQSRLSDARNRRKHGRWCGAPIHRRGRGG